MRKHLLVLGVVVLVALLATSGFAANRGVSFQGIGLIHPWDPGPYPASVVIGMTDDGSLLLTQPGAYGGYGTLTTFPGLEWSLIGSGDAFKMNGDGSFIVASYLTGEDGRDHGGYWNGVEDDFTLIPTPDGFVPCDYTATTIHGISSNGAYATGLTWTENCRARPFLWERATNSSVMFPSLNNESSRGNQPTADGSMVVGFNQKVTGFRRGAIWVNGTPEWIDGLGQNDAKICGDGSGCAWDPDCPDFVDAYCDNVGYCDKSGIYCDVSSGFPGVCVGGPSAGNSCYGDYQCSGYCNSGPNTGNVCGGDYDCPGTCVNGPNAGNECTGEYYCPDDPVCFENPNYNGEDEKGEAYLTTPDGQYVAGLNFGQSDWNDPNYDPYLYASGYRRNPDGSFTQLWPPEGVYPSSTWYPIDMTDDGSKIVGRFGGTPTLWSEETGTLDFQLFLVSQGLDDLYFWRISRVTTINADGTIVGGYGLTYVDPDCPLQYGCLEGWVANIAKVSVCHKDDLPAERTLTILWDSLDDHLGHGDRIGTCEFWEDGGARAADQRPAQHHDVIPPEFDYGQENGEQVQARRGLRFGEQFVPEQSVQQDDEASSPGPAVQREKTRRRVRRSR